MARVLVIEDEEGIREMVADYLAARGHEVRTADRGDEGLSEVYRNPPDLLVLDLMLPGLSGEDVIRTLRQRKRLPVVMLTAKASEGDRIAGLELGADDYLVKPFSLKELELRIRAVLRRQGTEQPEEIREGDLSILPGQRRVLRGGQPIALTRAEFAILLTMARSPGQVFSRLQLLESFQEDAFEGYDRSIDVHIKEIRRKLEPDRREPRYVHTVWGSGYRFEVRP